MPLEASFAGNRRTRSARGPACSNFTAEHAVYDHILHMSDAPFPHMIERFRYAISEEKEQLVTINYLTTSFAWIVSEGPMNFAATEVGLIVILGILESIA